MAGKHKTVDDYIAACPEKVKPLLGELRSFIHSNMPGATEEMRFGVPSFRNAHDVPVIYLFGSKDRVHFGFLRAAELSDPTDVLKGSGTPSKHVKIAPGVPFDAPLLADFVQQCEKIRA